MHRANPDPGFWRALAKAGSAEALVLAGLHAINPDPGFWKFLGAVAKSCPGCSKAQIARRGRAIVQEARNNVAARRARQERYDRLHRTAAEVNSGAAAFGFFGDVWDATGGKAVSWVADNPGTAATLAGVGACTVVSFGACGYVTVGALAVRSIERGVKTGWRDSLGTNLTDASITWASLGLVGAPASLGKNGLNEAWQRAFASTPPAFVDLSGLLTD